MGQLDVTETTRDSSGESTSRSRSPFKPLASEDFLHDSHNSGCFVSDEGGDENWLGFKATFDKLPKRNSATMHSIASTVTLTSNESSHGNSSFSNSSRSPVSTLDRRGNNSISSHKSPRRSPRNGCHASDSPVVRQIASLPLTTANGESPKNNRGKIKHNRRDSGERKPMDGKLKDGKYYQPSKASLHASNPNQLSKKPQRIRSRSKGPLLRRKSHVEPNAASQHNERTIGSIASCGQRERSKSCEPKCKGGICGAQGHSKGCELNSANKSTKKISPPVPRNRKKPLTVKTTETQVKMTNTSLHESWPRPVHKENKDLERQKVRERQVEKTKVTEKTKPGEKIKRKKLSSKIKKETKKGKKCGSCNDINDVITFFEDMAAHKVEIESSSPPPVRGGFKKSNSARALRRPQSVINASLGAVSAHGAPSSPSNNIACDIMDPSNKRRQRRSSAPAKALAAFHQYRNSIGASDFNDIDEPLAQAPPEKLMLDVSELAALEIIRLAKDNSLKLDVYDLVKYLKKQQLRKNTG